MEIERLIYKKMNQILEGVGAVLVTGPKFCGKTFISKKLCKSDIIIDAETIMKINSYGKQIFLEGPNPRLIDEWQNYPSIWDAVRNEIDNRSPNNDALYILTGSVKPFKHNEILHSGAGRINRLKMQTLSFAEILNLDLTHSISLKALFDKENINEELTTKYNLDNIEEMMIIGGWPSIISKSQSNFKTIVDGYIDSLIHITDKNSEYKEYNFRLEPYVFKRILQSLARLSSAQIKKSTIINDVTGAFEKDEENSKKKKQWTLDPKTLDRYLDLLYDTDVIFDIPVWNNSNIRSPYALRTKPKTYFCDTSLTCNLLNIKHINNFMEDANTTGLIFENQVMKDLLVYCTCLDAELYFYRDEQNNEIDAIIELDDGRWAAIEIKLSLRLAMEASDKLIKTINTMNLSGKRKEPEFKMIITNCDKVYKDKNGIYVIPHALLRP